MTILSRLRNAYTALLSPDSSSWTPVAISDTGGLPKCNNEEWLRIAAYFACVRNISEDVAKLPLITYRRLPRGKERASDHPYYNLLRREPHPSIGAIALRETVTRFALGWGNGYARIHRDGTGRVIMLEPIPPQLVKINGLKGGLVEYEVSTTIRKDKVASADMLHIHGVSSDGINGLSVLQSAQETLMFAYYAQRYGENIYSRGGRPSGILVHPNKMQPDAKQNLAKAWDEAYGGNNSGRTAVLDHGVEYKPISINPVDAQYLETRQFTVEEIARWFRMPLHKIQYLVRAQGWSTLDAQNTDYLTDTLMPWLVRWEEEIARKLFANDTEHFAEHLVTGLLRGDQTARSSFYTKQFSIGALSINEIREFENMNPIEGEGGDKHFVPMNMTPAEFAESVSGKSGGQQNAQP
ncbi:phage portal protein [Candidatus Pacearchaeota archaeon]|jgi:HK97 family phage portal protein|nr:phage portal protein [Candidatus Pacearchaeota archaeon]